MRYLHSKQLFWWVSLPALLFAATLLTVGSRLLINPTNLVVGACGRVIVTRNYPATELLGFAHPWVRYTQTVTPLTPTSNNGYVCREDNGSGQRYIHDAGRGFGSWTINHFANACLADPQGFEYEAQWTAYLFDMIPLRPVSRSAKVLAQPGACPVHEVNHD